VKRWEGRTAGIRSGGQAWETDHARGGEMGFEMDKVAAGSGARPGPMGFRAMSAIQNVPLTRWPCHTCTEHCNARNACNVVKPSPEHPDEPRGPRDPQS
jgi:hypothetical protein